MSLNCLGVWQVIDAAISQQFIKTEDPEDLSAADCVLVILTPGVLQEHSETLEMAIEKDAASRQERMVFIIQALSVIAYLIKNF